MATSSGNTTISSSSSEGNQNVVIILDDRKRKRMTSNRESARRSRVRKQQHLEDLTAKIGQLKIENNKLGQTIELTSQQFVKVESENSVLRAQMNELSQRLDSLNGMINDMNALNGVGVGPTFEDDLLGDFGFMEGYFGNFTHNNIINVNNPWDLGYLNQPIMTTNDGLQYEY